MKRIDIHVSENGRHLQTFSFADEGPMGDDVFLCGSTLSMNVLFWEKCIQCGISPFRSIEKLILPSQ